MRGSQVKILNCSAKQYAESYDDIIFEGTYQVKLPDTFIKQDNQICIHNNNKDELIFVQRKLHPRSHKKMVKEWKKFLKTLSYTRRRLFMLSIQPSFKHV